VLVSFLKSYHPRVDVPGKPTDRKKQFGVSPSEDEYGLMSIRALIVDDSSVMRNIVERSLVQAGIEMDQVFQAANGAEALTVLKDNPVDLILCDINMPVMDGLEFIKRLPGIENAKGVPVVMITTEGSRRMWCKRSLAGRAATSASRSRRSR
jgi:two-component system, chemotaxis family, chemotaxis protein CheY